MKRGTLLLLCVAVIAGISPAPTVLAQSPLSGTWKGTVVADGGSDRLQLIMTLQFDGNRVSGTAGPSPDDQNGTIAGGTFDPTNGALKLEVDVKDGSRTNRAVFDGRLVDHTAVGKFTLDTRVGRFLLTKDAGDARQAPAGGMDSAAALKQGFAEVSGWLLKAAEMVPPDKYSFRPVATVRTYGELLGHVADGYNYFCARAAGKKVEWSDAIAGGKTDKSTVVAALKASTAACTAAHGGAGAGSPPLLQNLGHANLHYGNVITYMRMLGLKPPSS
jgi:DinB family protein